MLNINIPRRYRGECEGAWKCAEAASTNMTSVKRAAIGWTMRMAERVVLVEVGRSKLSSWALLNNLSVHDRLASALDSMINSPLANLQFNSPVLYPISILLHVVPLHHPKTPKSTPPYEARGIDLTIGVEITDMRSKTKAANSKIVNGVAGRNIMKV